ncbi:dihydropteroate synthase [Myxococcota bacterium]|nr:dihydropteroate synthase [Myxococcota bacterium]
MNVRIAGVLNVTPDSFSDGGRDASAAAAIARGLTLWAEGADWVDVGGESTRPGAAPVPEEEELRRVLPVIEGLVAARAPVSIDTQKLGVARAALAAGARLVNDVGGLRAAGMAEAAAEFGAGVVIMHMRGDPQTMQRDTRYDDVVDEVRAGLERGLARALAAGVKEIWLDPGLGFGKDTEGNLTLLRRLPELLDLGFPLYVGASRKRFIGELTGRSEPAARRFGSVGAALAAVAGGASAVRVHDVAATRDALTVFLAARPPRVGAA